MSNSKIQLEKRTENSPTLLTHKSILKKLTTSYFRPKSFEKQGKIYEYFGMKRFKKGVLKITSRTRIRKQELEGSNYFIGSSTSIDSLAKFERKTRENEYMHTAGLIPQIGLAALGIPKEPIIGSIYFSLIILPQLYLIGLQRYNRARLYHVIDKLKLKEIKSQQ